MKIKLPYSVVCALIIALSGCSSNRLTTSSHHQKIKVPISINILTDKSASAANLNTDFYKLKIKDYLDDFREVDLVLVGSDDNADVVLDIAVKNLYISPTKESNSTRRYKKVVQVGTDVNGKPIMQATTADVYTESSLINSTTTLSSKFTFKDPSYKVSPQNYFAKYTWRHVGSTLGGDMQAFNISNSYHGAMLVGEPSPDELLFQLSNREMLTRISYDLRRYYQKLKK